MALNGRLPLFPDRVVQTTLPVVPGSPLAQDFTLFTSARAPYDLTGLSVMALLTERGRRAVTASRVATLTTPASGQGTVTFGGSETMVPGDYALSLVVMNGSTVLLRYPDVLVAISGKSEADKLGILADAVAAGLSAREDADRATEAADNAEASEVRVTAAQGYVSLGAIYDDVATADDLDTKPPVLSKLRLTRENGWVFEFVPDDPEVDPDSLDPDAGQWTYRGKAYSRVLSGVNVLNAVPGVVGVSEEVDGARGGVFDFSYSVATPDNVLTFAGKDGLWVRRWDGRTVDAAWAGADGAATASANRAALQSALDTATTQKARLAIAEGTYDLNAELVNNGVDVVGVTNAAQGSDTRGVHLRATAPMRSVMALRAGGTHLSGILFNANRQADYAVLGQGWAQSDLRHCEFAGALKDGFFSSAFKEDLSPTNNDNSGLTDCWFTGNGTVYRSSSVVSIAPLPDSFAVNAGGTVSTTIGSTTVTGTGTAFLATGARAGDIIQIGALFYEIAGVVVNAGHGHTPKITSNTVLELVTPATVTASGQTYAVYVGCGMLEQRHNDNNVNRYDGCLFRSNAGGGISINGLYGSSMRGGIVDNHRLWGVRVGNDANSDVVLGCVLDRVYFEGNVQGSVRASYARDLLISFPVWTGAIPEVIAAGGASYMVVDGSGVRGSFKRYTFNGSAVEEIEGMLYQYPKTQPSAVNEGVLVENARAIIPYGRRVSIGSLAAGATADVTVTPGNRGFAPEGSNLVASVTVSTESADGPSRAWVVSRTTATTGGLTALVRVRNDHSSAQTVYLNWTAVMP